MRRFFRFSIRDLLWLTLAVAVAMGRWLTYCSNTELRASVDKLKASQKLYGWRVDYDPAGEGSLTLHRETGERLHFTAPVTSIRFHRPLGNEAN